MKKAAEVGLHRLTVAMPSRVSSSELSEYLTIAIQMCETCQVISPWYKFALTLKSTKQMIPSFPFLKPSKDDEEDDVEDISSILSKEEQEALPLLSEKSLLYVDVSSNNTFHFFILIFPTNFSYYVLADYPSNNRLYQLLPKRYFCRNFTQRP